MAKTIIRVGHGAYTGNNKLRMCFSKAQAVRVLRARGVKRDDARKAVNIALAKGGINVPVPEGWPATIEVCDYSAAVMDYDYSKKSWASAPEL